jgi:small subunit ribosomal protein S20
VEGVDLAGNSEVVRGNDLANEAEDAREGGEEREDRRRPGEPAAGALVHPREYREGTLWYHAAAREVAGLFTLMPNIRQQKKRVRTAAKQRLENLHYRSTAKTLAKRLETAVKDGDKDRVAAEHRELVRWLDRAAARGAMHRNTGRPAEGAGGTAPAESVVKTAAPAKPAQPPMTASQATLRTARQSRTASYDGVASDASGPRRQSRHSLL